MNTESSLGPSGLDHVRRRGVFLISALMWAAAAGIALIASAHLVFLLNQALALAARLQAALGLRPATDAPDWAQLAIVLAIAAIPLGALAVKNVWKSSGRDPNTTGNSAPCYRHSRAPRSKNAAGACATLRRSFLHRIGDHAGEK
jgi:hypothetical protein